MAPPVNINTVPGKRLYFIFILKIKFQPVDNRRKSYLEISMSFLHRRQNKLLVSTRMGDNSELFSFSLGHRMCTVLIQYRFYVPLIAQLLYYTKKRTHIHLLAILSVPYQVSHKHKLCFIGGTSDYAPMPAEYGYVLEEDSI